MPPGIRACPEACPVKGLSKALTSLSQDFPPIKESKKELVDSRCMVTQRCGVDETERARLCLALTCGLPGAGKTSLCKALLAYSTPDILVRHICFDDFLQCEPSESHERDENDGAAFKVVAAPLVMHTFYASSNGTG